MRCEKCGNEYPSGHYFMVEETCNECWERMDEHERAAALRHAAKEA